MLYIGPQPSHVTEILDATGPELPHALVAHGDTGRAVQQIQQLRQRADATNRQTPKPVQVQFSQATLLPQLVAVIEATDTALPADA